MRRGSFAALRMRGIVVNQFVNPGEELVDIGADTAS